MSTETEVLHRLGSEAKKFSLSQLIATCYECEGKTYISCAQVLSYNSSTRRITLVTSALQDTL